MEIRCPYCERTVDADLFEDHLYIKVENDMAAREDQGFLSQISKS